MNVQTAIMIVTVCLMATMTVQAYNSAAMDSKLRIAFMKGFVVVGICGILDWLRVIMNGSMVFPVWLHSLVVSLEYTLAPLVVLLMIGVLGRMKEYIFLLPLLIVNAGLQLTTQGTEAIFYIDSMNHFVRGDYFRIYVFIYTVGIISMYRAVYQCSQEYQNRHSLVLIMSMLTLTIGVGVNEAYVDEFQTTFLSVAIASVMFYIYFLEMGLQTDALTKLLNRRCYNSHLCRINYDTAIIMFDVNKFKGINDTYGHDTGDRVLKQVGGALRHVFGKVGYIYRIGGDEFAMILKKNHVDKVDFFLMDRALAMHIDRIRRQKYPVMPNVSMGYAVYRQGISTIDEVIKLADQQMYQQKSENR